MLRKLFRYLSIGLLIGSFTYLVILIFASPAFVTSSNIISVLLMSGGIGLISAIFEIEWNMLLEIVIHFVITLGLVLAMCSYNNYWPGISQHILANFLFFLLIYVLIWLGIYLSQLADMKRLNQQIKNRNKKK